MHKNGTEDKNVLKKKSKKGRKHVTIMLAVISFSVWGITMFIKLIGSFYFGYEFHVLNIFDGILDNILGILPPIILFDFAYEYFTQDYISEEVSEQISRTLMGDSDTINLFDRETRENFVHATLVSLLDQEKGDMVYNLSKPYLKKEDSYFLRKYYDYSIVLRECYKNEFGFEPGKYIGLLENYSYREQSACNQKREKIKIGFFLNEVELDESFDTEEYLFREDLNIRIEDFNRLAEYSDNEKEKFVKQFMQVKVFIQEKEIEIEKVLIERGVITIVFENKEEVSDELKVEIGFFLPQRRGASKFLAFINKPTYSPRIDFSYETDIADVIMQPFLNGNTTIRNCSHFDGRYQIKIQDEWIMPKSGVMFIINTKD